MSGPINDDFPTLDRAAEKSKAEEKSWEISSKMEGLAEPVMVSRKPEPFDKVPKKTGDTPADLKADWKGDKERLMVGWGGKDMEDE